MENLLRIQKISKTYRTGELVQEALHNVSLNLRDSEFVAVLGPSGSGKTTLLNIIGGLDRYESGDLIINGISTKKYRDRDWDSYRNHTIGFVFQSYNLIPHQTVLSNVELALTISGISKAERRRRASEALEKVGLGNQLHKRPNEMSGGQMQRVAIARALVNDPDILLADEPTGALDSETSVQVMELLKEVARDRLVVMVTHNPELAQQYATRIVRLKDGEITDDTRPYEVEENPLSPPVHANMGKSSMSFFTALSLSFNNLRTKKGRTLLTAFAGSIGIIGIALILSLSNGVNAYIEDIQKETMTSYPISIQATTFDMSSLLGEGGPRREPGEVNHGLDQVYSNGRELEMVSGMASSLTENNLTVFKNYLEASSSPIHDYVGENGIVYSYDTRFSVYATDPEGELVNTDGSTLSSDSGASAMVGSMAAMSSMSPMGSMTGSGSNRFSQLMPGGKGELISPVLTENYEVLYGAWPQAYDEVIVALDSNNEISASTLYQLGLLPSKEYRELMDRLDEGEKITVEETAFSYEELCAQSFRLLPACDGYEKQENGNFMSVIEDKEKLSAALGKALELKVVGVVRPKDRDTTFITSTMGYTTDLTDYLVAHAEESEIVRAQQEQKDVNVLSGLAFSPSDDDAKIADAKRYLQNLGVSDKARLCRELMQAGASEDPQAAAQMARMDETQLAAELDVYLENPDEEALLGIYDAYISTGSYEDNMTAFGVVSLDAPSSISIYADSFENKDAISQCITDYNAGVGEEDQITYTDYVALLMSSITTIINVISYVLIAFVAVSLIVSSIMIGIITYISVLERTKEIGVLRAIGASKHNVSQVFNAETFIIGLCSGVIGIGVTLLLLIPGNAIIHEIAGTTDVSAALPFVSGVVLVVLSVILTLIGGLIPSRKAAKKDPVAALRSE